MLLDSKAIGLRLLQFRKELKLTRDAFGSKIGVQGYVIRNIEGDKNKKVNEPLLISIASQYSINKEWLLYGTGEMYTKTKKSVIDDLVTTYKLSNYGKQIIKTYLDLPDDKRTIIDEFVAQLTNNVSIDATLTASQTLHKDADNAIAKFQNADEENNEEEQELG